jgi:hypothetical protein
MVRRQTLRWINDSQRFPGQSRRKFPERIEDEKWAAFW